VFAFKRESPKSQTWIDQTKWAKGKDMHQSKVLDEETEILQGRKKKRNNFWRPQNTLIHKAILTKENKRCQTNFPP
jgi:hypothetical protein